MPADYGSLKPTTPAGGMARAAKAYQLNHLQGASDRTTMAEAMRVIIHTLLLARDAYAAQAIDEMCTHNAKNLKIIDVLREEMRGSGALKDAEAQEAAQFLNKLYTDAILRISNILAHPKPVEEFDALMELFKPVYKAWLAAPTPTNAPTAEPPPQQG